MRVTLACLGLAVTSLSVPLNAQEVADTRSVTDRYVELTFERRYDELLDLYAPDAVFFDPTGDVFRGRVSEGPMTGAADIIALQKSWGIAEARFDVDVTFSVGEYSLYRGVLTVRFDGSDTRAAVPFVTVLRARNGRIVERTDFGEYVESFGLGDGFDAATERTRSIADRYLTAYLEGDIETQASLLAGDVRFQDPTSKVFGPPSGELYRGADELLTRRRHIYANIRDFGFEAEPSSFAANHHAVYMGTVEYTVGSGARYRQPAVIVIEVRDGRVARQWDFVDYTVGPTG